MQNNFATTQINNMDALTTEEQNLVKDVLRVIGLDEEMNSQFARACGMEVMGFSLMADEIFNKLGNGRVTFDSVGDGKGLI